jgi:P27 family predicted phage terminase small subunit
MWNRVWSAGRQWLSPDSDYVLIAMLCQAQDEAEEIRRVLAIGAEKRYYTIANGQQVTSPLVKQLKELRIQITGWLASLGYSPTDRARLGLGEVRHSDALDELNRKRAERMKAVNE